MTDNVNKPAHYRQGEIECIDAIRAALTPEEFRGHERLNPDTGEPFRKGDIRSDGFVFVCYVRTRIRKDGQFYEKWLSPDGFLRQMESQRRGGEGWRRRRGDERKRLLNGIKLRRGCARCGYREHAAALDFDHKDPNKKKFNISTRYIHATDSDLMAELNKCEVLCANCHRVRTFEEKHRLEGAGDKNDR